MSWLYSDKEFRNIKKIGEKVYYEVWTTGFFPRHLFNGNCGQHDFIILMVDKENV